MNNSRKTDWIVIEIYHERYMFSTDIHLFKDTKIKDIKINNTYIYKTNIKKLNEGNAKDERYIIDYCTHTGKDKNKIHLECVLIMPLDVFIKEGYESFVWGQTKTKYGLLDLEENNQ